MDGKKDEVRCPLCGYVFAESELVCSSSCPFAEKCNLACCPNCGYKIVKESRTVKWIKRFLGR